MELDINQRIRLIVEESGKSVNSYSSFIGVSQPTLKACIDGNNAPRYDTLQKILIANPMISAEWLMRGIGPMIRQEHTTEDPRIESMKTEINLLRGENRVLREQLGLPERKETATLSA